MSKPNNRYKMYLVEEFDDDRERVIEALVTDVEFNISDGYNTYSTWLKEPFMVGSETLVKARVVPSSDGTFFTIINFKEEFYEGS